MLSQVLCESAPLDICIYLDVQRNNETSRFYQYKQKEWSTLHANVSKIDSQGWDLY